MRYYCEIKDGAVMKVVAQDERGLVVGLIHEGRVYVRRERRPDTMWIKLPGWEKAREVKVTDRDFLEFVRTWERGSYTETTPTEIREAEGDTEEIVRGLLMGQQPGKGG